MRNNDDGETDDDLVEGSLEDGKSDSCNNCGRYLDNMTEMEERFDARTHELEETHDQELQELRKSHNKEVAALRNDNAGLKKKIVEQENSEKEMKRQIEFLSGMLRQAEARREEDARASQRMSDEHHGSSVTMSVAKIVGKNLFLFSSPT